MRKGRFSVWSYKMTCMDYLPNDWRFLFEPNINKSVILVLFYNEVTKSNIVIMIAL